MARRVSTACGAAARSAFVRAFVLSLLAGCAGPPRPPAAPAAGGEATAPEFAAAFAAEVFDSAWSRIQRSHYDSTFRGVDWQAVRVELRPRAEQARTTAALRGVIQEMLARLGESHYTLIPHELADAVDPERIRAGAQDGVPGDAGLQLRVVEGSVIVTEVVAGGPAEAAGVRAGWTVQSIDGRDLAAPLAALEALGDASRRRAGLTRFLWGINGLLDGAAGSTVELRVRDGDDQPQRVALRRRPEPGEPVRLGNLPTFLARLDARTVDASGGCVGVIRFNVWMIPLVREFDRALDTMRACRGIVIDLRGNPGGVAGMLMGIAGHFLDEPVPLGVMRSRSGELRFVANPRRVSAGGQPVQPFAGPLAVVVDGMTASTSEFFAGGMQAIGRARVFGDTTAGQALPAVVSRLPNNDVLMYVVADYADPDGRRFEGGGVPPDVSVPLRRDELLAGRDAALQAALDWLANAATGGTGSAAPVRPR